MLRGKKKLTNMRERGVEITEVQDNDVLLDHSINKTHNLIKADAGSIYICI